jgi:preprotein translocase subunit SecG
MRQAAKERDFMTTVIIVIHLMVVVAMIGLILLQRSEGGALGIGGGQNAFLTGRGAGNVLSHTTAYLAIAFFATSLGLAFIAKYQAQPGDILERLPGQTAPVSETPAPAEPMGAPTSAEDLLKQLGGSSSQSQTLPASNGAVPQPSAPNATETQSPAAQEPVPPAGDAAPAPAQPAPAQ